MKKPFDTIVGPNGVWKDDGAAEGAYAADGAGSRTLRDMNAREEFVLRCLNAASNLYGVLTMADFVSLYNGYAKSHDAPVSAPLTFDELDRLFDFFLDCPGPDSESPEAIAAEPDVWFSTFAPRKDVWPLIAYRALVEPDLSDAPTSPEDIDRFVEEQFQVVQKRIAGLITTFHKLPPLVLPEADFFCYEDPMCGEETRESRAFVKFVKKEYGLPTDVAELDTMGIQAAIRTRGAMIAKALEYVRDSCDWRPSDLDAFWRLVNAVCPLVGATRTWEGRGRTHKELVRMGLCMKLEKDDTYDVFGLGGTSS